MACTSHKQHPKVIIHDFKTFFATLADVNEIPACYDCAHYPRTVPGLYNHYACMNFNMPALTNLVHLQEASKFFCILFSAKLSIVILTAVSDK